jgi:hypothetical protein
MHTIDLRNSGGKLIVLGGAFTLPTADHIVNSPINGSLRWNPTSLTVEYYNGAWLSLSSGQVHFAGLWNAVTNTPHLTSGIGTVGDYYKVSVTGHTMIDGLSDWFVGDSIIFDGTTWDKLAGSDFPTITLSGDVTGSGLVNIPVTLADSGVVAGSYSLVTVDTKGRVTVGAEATTSDLSDVQLTTLIDKQILVYDSGLSKWKNISPPYDIYGTFMGSPADGQTIWRIVIARPVTFPQDLVDSVSVCLGSPLGDVSMPILKNGGQIGSIDFLGGTTQANFVFADLTVFDSGDVLQVDAPSPADATFFSPSWAFVCHR